MYFRKLGLSRKTEICTKFKQIALKTPRSPTLRPGSVARVPSASGDAARQAHKRDTSTTPLTFCSAFITFFS
jgi:hypothetical protein